MTPSAEIESGPHRWKASALTTRPTLLTNTNQRHTVGKEKRIERTVGVVLKAFQNDSLIVGIEVGTNGLNLCVIRLHMRCNFSEMMLATRT